MTVIAPPRAPRPPERDAPADLEALIEEARRRARRRRLRTLAVLLATGALVAGALAARHDGGGAAAIHRPAPPARPVAFGPRPLPANGDLALVRDNAHELIARAPDGSRTRHLATCPGPSNDCYIGSFSWSPDGKLVAFLAGHIGGAITASNLALYVVAADGTRVRDLAHCGNCDHAQPLSWSPDGRSVAFIADTGLEIADVASGNVRALEVGRELESTVGWSPNGGRLALAAGNGLYSVSPIDGRIARLAEVSGAGWVGHLAWSPNAAKIAFDSGDDLYVVGADGSHLRRLLGGSFGSGPGAPSWSPDGRRILYFFTPRADRHYRGQVWSMRPDGSSRTLLYDEGCCVGAWQPPIWSPDGRLVAFAGATETDGVVVMDAKGRHRRQLLTLPSPVAWQPLPRR
jgi:Tol biopolymer transport system component